MANSGGQGRACGGPKKRVYALARWVFGGVEEKQPPEGILSAICEAFSCTPEEALKQDPAIVIPVLEYRMAMAAKEQHNRDATKMTDSQARMLKLLSDTLREFQGEN